MSLILTLNAGSSSLKFALYEAKAEPVQLLTGQVENIGAAASLQVKGAEALSLGKADHQGAVDAILTALGPHLAGRAVSGVGHRVVHGGPDYSAPVVVDADHLAALEALEPLAPLHQPHNLAAIRAAQAAFPAAIQVACFDTAFHRGHPFVHDTFALPRRFYDQGVRRYGFHGLSYDYIAGCLARDWPELARGRVVVAHLGNGASLCAMKNGRSVGSSMGFTALDGVPMGTRPGQLDPGVLLYLLDHEGMDGPALTRLLYHESGLKGLSGISHDMRTLLESDAEAAREAVAHYVFRLRREIGAMSAVLGGLDALVFCGGVGEHARPIRAGVLEGMGYLGLALDADANEAQGPVISSGSVPVLVIPTDEERVIARAVAAALT